MSSPFSAGAESGPASPVQPRPQSAGRPSRAALLPVVLATLAAAALIAGAWWLRSLLGQAYADRWGMVIFLILLLWADAVVSRLARRRLICVASAVAAGAAIGVATLPLLAGLILIVLVPLALAGSATLVGLIPWTRKRFDTRRLVLVAGCSVLAGLTCLAPGLCTAIFTDAMPSAGALDDQLAFVHHTDQTDRSSGAILFDDSRDRARLRLVRAIVAEEPALEGRNAYRAALILQHGVCASDYQTATTLFEIAATAGVADAAALAQAAYDRWQLSLGLPQRYGTQLALQQHADNDTC